MMLTKYLKWLLSKKYSGSASSALPGPEPAYMEWSGQGTGLDCNSLMCHGMQTMPKLEIMDALKLN